MADDWPYEIVANGEATGVVELPVEWILDDAPYFGFSRYSALRPHSTPDDVLSIWKAEFDMAHAEGGMFLLTMHPHVIGHRSRVAHARATHRTHQRGRRRLVRDARASRTLRPRKRRRRKLAQDGRQ